ncbi:MAG: hypothetical protein H7287_01415 [Thermoleophilia bacterium]|nr:hypothetical protein [Thermoleophilia bacterium]
MTVTSMTPTSALAALGTTQLQQPMNSYAALGAVPLNGGVGAATLGVANVTAAKPSIGQRLVNAMKAAIGELRGAPAAAPLQTLPAGQAIVTSPQPSAPVSPTVLGAVSGAMPAGTQTLAATARGTGTAQPLANRTKLKASSLTAKQKAAVKVRVAAAERKEQAAAKAAAKVAVASAGTAAIGAVPATGAAAGALPANATQLPNATVYSYDQRGNPAVAGLAGLPQATQQQLGILGQFGNQVDGLAGQTVPQTNQTNQTSIPTGAGVGGLGLGMGTSVPTLGQAIYNPPVTPETIAAQKVAADKAAAAKAAGTATTGSTQAVHNQNSNDQSALNQNPGYGSGFGFGGSGAQLPYGSSMNGYVPGQQGGIGGFFSRLFG